MANVFETLLAEKGVLLADGATGTTLFERGLEAGAAPELWNADEPDRIETLYRDAVDAGSDLFLTNSFGGTAARLRLHEAQGRVRELNRIAAEIGREVADSSGRTVVVAGSVGPTGELMEPLGPLVRESAVEMFHEQADALKEGGADVLWLETISAPEEFEAAAEAFALAEMPWTGTMSFDTAGRTMMGMTAVGLARLVSDMSPGPLAFGANCGVGASDLLRTVLGFAGAEADLPVIAKGNAGIPKFVDGHVHYDGTPELMADYAALARDAGASVIGGCCGTGAAHIRAMREALDTRERGPVPTLERLVDALGPFSSESDGNESPDGASGTGESGGPAGAGTARRGRRRRRGEKD